MASRRRWMGGLLLAASTLLLHSQSGDADREKVTIDGDVAHPLTITLEQLRKRPHLTLEVVEHGKKISYGGVSLHEVLEEVGAPVGPALKGKALTTYLLAQARDGYEVVFALAETDPAITDKQILLADSAGGMPLSESQGPLRLVVAGDKKPARSLRMLTKITVVQLSK